MGGGDPSKGVIKQDRNGVYRIYFYRRGGSRPYSKKGELDELKELLSKFREAGCNPESWNKIMNTRRDEDRNIYCRGDRWYEIRKRIKGKDHHFGVFSEKSHARFVRNFLEFKKWDLQYKPSKVCNKRQVPKDEYYFHMLPYITGDKAYQKYLQSK